MRETVIYANMIILHICTKHYFPHIVNNHLIFVMDNKNKNLVYTFYLNPYITSTEYIFMEIVVTFQQNPFGTVSSLSDEEKENIQNNMKVPTLEELLDVAMKYDKYIIFDFPAADFDNGISEEHPYYNSYEDVVIRSILKHNISQSKVSGMSDLPAITILIPLIKKKHFTHLICVISISDFSFE